MGWNTPSSLSELVLKICISAMSLLIISRLISFWLAIRRIKCRKEPLGFRQFKPYIIDPKESTLTNHFSLKKVQEMMKDQDGTPGSWIDYIIIGSGIGGLTCASLLSRLGYKCLVLEQHDRAGGCMHVYDDKGYEFDTGLHYVGREGYPRAIKALQHVDLGTEWERMGTKDDNFTFDRVHLPSGRIVNLKSRPLFYTHLKEEFPEEDDAIDRFEKLVKRGKYFSQILLMAKTLSFVEWLPFFPRLIHATIKIFNPWLFSSVHDIMTKLTDDKDLQAVLAGNFCNVGSTPKTTSFSYFCDMLSHYVAQGGFYPVGGPADIVKGIIPMIQRAGGKVLVKAKVTEIIIKSGKACGVTVTKGRLSHQIMSAGGVISSGGLINTYKLTPSKFRHKICKVNPVKTLKPSCQHVSIFLGFRGDQKELKLPNTNDWHMLYIDEDYEKSYSNPLEGKSIAFIGFPSAKDPAYNKRVPGKSVGIVITTARFEIFEQWQNQKVKSRDGDYLILKNQIAEKLLDNTIFKTYPELRERLEYMDVGTPLSTSYYLSSWRGGSYGLQWSEERYYDTKYRARTKIPGLFMTGQDIMGPSWAAAFFSGILTTNSCLGYDDLPHGICGSHVLKDVMKLLPKLTSEDFPCRK